MASADRRISPECSGPWQEQERNIVRYRGFVLIPQSDLGWLIRPERSPMTILPFRVPPNSLSDVKALVDRRLNGNRSA
ncbi:MAG: hypothetical protein WAM11_13090 [Cyanobium sp.]